MDGETAVIGAPAPKGPLDGRWLWVGAAAAVAIGIALVVAILLTARIVPLPAAAADGQAAPADAASPTLAQAIEEGTALAASTSANQLADPTAYSQLMGALATARTVLAGDAPAAEAARREIVAAIDQVRRSLSAKALADAQSELSAVIGTAVQVNAGAAGRVPDDAVRAELQARVDAGWALLATNATLDAVLAQAQSITDQTAVVLDARFMGFREADGKWCAAGGSSCVVLAWPVATLASGDWVELAGGENALDGSGCYATEEFRVGKDRAAFLFCPAGESVPDGRRAAGSDVGDVDRDRLWMASGPRLTELRYRA